MADLWGVVRKWKIWASFWLYHAKVSFIKYMYLKLDEWSLRIFGDSLTTSEKIRTERHVVFWWTMRHLIGELNRLIQTIARISSILNLRNKKSKDVSLWWKTNIRNYFAVRLTNISTLQNRKSLLDEAAEDSWRFIKMRSFIKNIIKNWYRETLFFHAIESVIIENGITNS